VRSCADGKATLAELTDAISALMGTASRISDLQQLFERYPRLTAWLVLQIRQHRVTLRQMPSNDGIRIR
jgi:hypothetical protein